MSVVPNRNYRQLISLALIPFFFIVIEIFVALDIQTVDEPPYLLLITNTVFVGLIPLYIAYLSFRTYTTHGRPGVLLIGGGMLGMGMGSILAGMVRSLPDGANLNVTVYNTAFFVGAVFAFSAALANTYHPAWLSDPKRTRTAVLLYAGVALFTLFFTGATLMELIPRFFTQDFGPTLLRQGILISAIVSLAASSVIFYLENIRKREDFFFWIALSLGLIAIGLLAFAQEMVVGGLVGWSGRTAEYVGACFALVAYFGVRNTASAHGVPVEETLAQFFGEAEVGYRALVEASTSAIVVLEPDDRVLIWNPAAEHMFGYSKTEAVGTPITLMAPGDGLLSAVQTVRGPSTPGKSGHPSMDLVETIARRKDGSEFPIDISVFGHMAGSTWVRTCMLRDITERKKAEMELVRTRNVLTEAQEIAHLGSFEYVPATRTTVWSEEEFRIYGLDPLEPSPAYDALLEKYIHPDDAVLLDKTFSKAIQAGSIYELEHRIVRPDGTVRWVYNLAHPHLDEKGTLERYVGTTLDITERKRTEEALQQSEERFRAAQELSPDGFTILRPVRDVAGNIVDFIWVYENDAIARINGTDPKAVIGKSLLALFPGHQSSKFFDMYVRTATTREASIFEEIYQGETITEPTWFRIVVVGMNEDIAVLAQDVTERKKAEEVREADVAALTRMHDLSSKLLDKEGLQPLLQEIMDTAVAILRADKGTLQLVDGGTLRIVAAYGHQQPFLDFFASAEQQVLACGRAMKDRSRVLIPDVEESDLFVGTLPLLVFREAGVRSIQSTPMVSRSGALLGILTTQWGVPNMPNKHDLWQLDLLVRQAADLIEYAKAEEVLRESQARQTAAEAVEKERQRLFDVLETMPIMISLLTPDYRVAFANRSFQETFGESKGRHCYEYCFGRTEPCEFCESYKVLETGKPHHWEVARENGSVIEAYDYPFTDVDGSPLILEMDIDVTEQRQAKESVERAYRYARSLIEASPDPLVTISAEGKITDVNEATVKATGVSREELIGSDFSQYFTEPAKAETGYQQVFREGHVTDYPLTLRSKDGHLTDVLYNATLYRDSRGEVEGIFAAARDITVRKRFELELKEQRNHLEDLVEERTKALNQYAENLKRSNEDLERFAYIASHDLQEPLRNVVSFSQLLARRYQGKLSTDADEYIGYIVEGGKRMQALVQDLLEYSRVHTKGQAFQEVKSEEIIDRVLQNLASSIQESNAVIRTTPLPTILADPTQVTLVFQNLIGNAIKFRRIDVQPHIAISVEKMGEMWKFAVKDNGIGIDPAFFDRIFEIFQRLHTRDKYPGTGVGLAIVKKIIDRHGGQIWLESDVGKGSSFYFTLPAAGGYKGS